VFDEKDKSHDFAYEESISSKVRMMEIPPIAHTANKSWLQGEINNWF